MTYVIHNHTQNKFVALPGMKKSFTKFINNARRFDTEAQAKADCCGDETPREFKPTVYPWSW